MQSLEVISINMWQILISLMNLVILFVIIKIFLFKPVKKVMAQRQELLNKQYEEAEAAKHNARVNEELWAKKMDAAKSEAELIINKATANANKSSDKIIADAKENADIIIRRAENEAVLERKKAEDGIKKEIVNVSAALTEKILNREINTEDHRALIDSVIKGLGDDNDGSK